MNVQELRNTLHEHADRAVDIGAPARVAATHHRVAVVRRRRRAGVAAGVAAAVVAVVTAGAIMLLPDHQTVQPAEHTPPAKLAGYKVARTFDLAPWKFRYVRGVQSERGQNLLDLDLPASDRPRVIGWGVSTETFAQATLSLDGRVIDRSPDGAWGTGDVLAPGRAHHLTVRFKRPSPSNRAGIAVYDLVGRPPAGVTNGTSVFRQQMAGDRLLGAKFAAPGETSLSFDVTVPDTRVSFSIMCSGVRPGAMADLTVNGSPLAGSGCDQVADLDAGGNRIGQGDQGWGASLGIRPGATLHVTLRLGRHGKAPGPTGDLVLGAAVYHDAPAVARVAGWEVPELVEGPDGHLYRFTDDVESRPGQRRLVLHLPASPRHRFVQYASAHAHGMLTFGVSGQVSDGAEQRDSGGGFGGGHELRPGRPYTVTLTLRHGVTPRTVLGLVVSTRTD